MSNQEVIYALEIVSQMGLGPDRVEAYDGWRADLDGDRIGEAVLRGRVDGEETVLVLDPISTDQLTSPIDTRLFVAPARVMSGRRLAAEPFAFRKGKFVYLAWISENKTDRYMEVIRSDGTGFVPGGFELKAP